MGASSFRYSCVGGRRFPSCALPHGLGWIWASDIVYVLGLGSSPLSAYSIIRPSESGAEGFVTSRYIFYHLFQLLDQNH